MAHTVFNALEMGQEARMGHVDFSDASDRINHQGIMFKLCSVGVGGSVLPVLTQFLSNRLQYVVVDGCRSKLVNVVRGASGKCFGSQLWKTSSTVMLTTLPW